MLISFWDRFNINKTVCHQIYNKKKKLISISTKAMSNSPI